MNARDILTNRLASQQIASAEGSSPSDVVARLLAMQAQDYRGALWSIGLRLPRSNIAQIEQAIAARTIVRTWPMRRTLHFVAATDVRWMLQLLAPRAIRGMAGRLAQLEIDDAVLARSRKALGRALGERSLLTREEMYDVLARAKVPPANQRGIHVISRLSQEGLLCFGPHRGNAPTFALMNEWIPQSRDLDRDEALAQLTWRYFRGHGPATIRDFAWWAGITLGDARAGVAMSGAELLEESVDGKSYIVSRSGEEVSAAAKRRTRGLFLLPGFDEYMLGYSDRTLALDPANAQKIVPGNNGVFKPTIVSCGRVVGTWRAAAARGGTSVTPVPFARLSASNARAFATAEKRYREFREPG
ncbi:MAG TPA: winged helix DNA-binding domain-containing protein [Gemmatimonadaceae bacterium]|nr:winged helix DNA-binding domain-containing protein [Gemmatimonadaceae bacterium]